MIKFILSLFLCFSFAHATPEAEKMIQGIGDQVVVLLKNEKLTLDDRAQAFQQIFNDHFNTKAIGKFVLGKYWKQAGEEERQQFLTFFKDVTIYNYATKFQEYTAETLKVTGSRQEDDGAITVLSEISRPEGNNIHVNWKLYEKDEGLKIYDVFLENVSMSITQRSEYASVIQKEGGKVSGLNQVLAAKIDGYKKSQ